MSDFQVMLDKLLLSMKGRRATDLHIVSDEPVYYRIDGEMIATDLVLSSDQIYSLCIHALDPLQQNEFLQNNTIDFGYSVERDIENNERFRGNLCLVRGQNAAVFRRLETKISTMNELGLPQILKQCIQQKSGLIIVTGATGSGKTTSLAAMIDFLNENKKLHITTAENPIEYIHQNKRSLITQREIGSDTPDFSDCLRDALRRDPDVVMVGELRDRATVSMAVGGAGTGHLVMGTLHTNNAPDSINRLLDLYDGAARDLLRSQLSSYLVAILSQQLVKKKEEEGRVALFELLIPNKKMRQHIRDGKTELLYDEMAKAKDEGNILMVEMYEDFRAKGVIE